jgi:lipopolysaccharide biosynthesis glycosyltransferase
MKTINIALAADNKFAVLAATLLKSVEIAHKDEDIFIRAFLISNNISKKRLEKIKKSIDFNKIELNILNPLESDFEVLKGVNNYKKLTHYHRLILPYLLPNEIERLLYLDCDIIVLKSLYNLFNTNLSSNNIVAAVRDQRVKAICDDWQAIENYNDFNLDPDKPYFNSGVLLMDLKKWKSENISQKVVSITQNNPLHVKWFDQYGLNVALYDKWKVMDKRWNHFPTNQNQEISITHFVTHNPNTHDYNGPNKKLFYQILDSTAWKGKRPRYFNILNFIPTKIAYKIKMIIQPW